MIVDEADRVVAPEDEVYLVLGSVGEVDLASSGLLTRSTSSS